MLGRGNQVLKHGKSSWGYKSRQTRYKPQVLLEFVLCTKIPDRENVTEERNVKKRQRLRLVWQDLFIVTLG